MADEDCIFGGMIRKQNSKDQETKIKKNCKQGPSLPVKMIRNFGY